MRPSAYEQRMLRMRQSALGAQSEWASDEVAEKGQYISLMRFATNKIKRKLAILLIFLLFINSFMSYAGDNDGSAFITKAEFDSLKNTFQSQLDAYNTGIDNKIDAAIAAYLSGVRLNRDPINLYEKAVVTAGGEPIWLQSINKSSSSVITDISITQTLHHTGNVITNTHFDTKYTNGTAKRWIESVFWIGDVWEWGAGWVNRRNSLWMWQRSWVYSGSGTQLTEKWPGANSQVNGSYLTTDQKKKKTNWSSQSFTHPKIGAGALFVSQTLGGKTYLKSYANQWYPFFNVDVWFHTYTDYQLNTGNTASYLSNQGKAPGTTHTTFTLTPVPGGKVTHGTKYGDDSTSVGDYGEMTCGVNKILDKENYLNFLYSIKSDETINSVDEDYQGVVDTTAKETITIEDGKFYDIYYTELGGVTQENKLNGGKVEYYPIKVVVNSKKLDTFDSYVATAIAGETVKNCAGLPLCETVDDDQKIKIKMQINSAHNNSINVQFANTSFTKGMVPTSNILYTANVNANALEEYTLNMKKHGYIWVFISNNTNKEEISIDETTFDVQLLK